MLRTLFRLGVRVASLTHFGRNSLADGSAEEATRGRLTRLGLQAVELMEGLGMLVDVSHLSMVGTAQVLEIATRPVMASHSSCHSLQAHHRNLPDEFIAPSPRRVGSSESTFSRASSVRSRSQSTRSWITFSMR